MIEKHTHIDLTHIQLIDSRLAVKYQFLEQFEIKYGYIKEAISKKIWEKASRGWVFYDTVLQFSRTKLRSKLPPLEEVLSAMNKASNTTPNNIKNLLNINRKLHNEIHAERILSNGEIDQLVRLVSWIKLFSSEDLSLMTTVGVTKARKFQALCHEEMLKEWESGKLYGQKIENIRVLRRKVQKYKVDGWRGLLDRRLGNTNRLVFNELHQSMILTLAAKPQKLDAREVWKRYSKVCKAKNMPFVSHRRVQQYLNQDHIKALISAKRHGRQYCEVNHRPFVHRKRPENSFVMLAGDGMFLGKPVRYTRKNKNTGKLEKTTRQLVIWLWFDVHSEAIVGYEFAYSESLKMIRQAFRRTLNLNADLAPLSIHVDAKWQKNPKLKKIMDTCGVHIQEKRAYNPKSSMAERMNEEVNRYHRRLETNWTSSTNNSVQFTHNPEHIRKAKAVSYDEATRYVVGLINMYNNDKLDKYKGKSRIEIANEAIHEECRILGLIQKARAFGNTRIVQVRNGAFKIHIEGIRYEYQILNLHSLIDQFAKGNKVRVYFDERNMDEVEIYRFEDRENLVGDTFISKVKRLKRAQMSRIIQTEEDREVLKAHREEGSKFDEWQEEILEGAEEILDDAGALSLLEVVGQDEYKEAQQTQYAKMFNEDFFGDDEDAEIQTQTVQFNFQDKSKEDSMDFFLDEDDKDFDIKPLDSSEYKKASNG